MNTFTDFIGTKEVQGKHLFDVAALEAYLLQHLPGFAGPLTAEMFKGGQSNPTYKLNTPSAQDASAGGRRAWFLSSAPLRVLACARI